jgi:hypothetical protein
MVSAVPASRHWSGPVEINPEFVGEIRFTPGRYDLSRIQPGEQLAILPRVRDHGVRDTRGRIGGLVSKREITFFGTVAPNLELLDIERDTLDVVHAHLPGINPQEVFSRVRIL